MTDNGDADSVTAAIAGVAARLDELARASEGMLGLAELTRQAFSKAKEESDISAALTQLLEDAHVALSSLFHVGNDRAEFSPDLVLADGTVRPPLPPDQHQQRIERWSGLRETVSDSAWRARFGHLVLESGRVTGKERALLAADVARDYLAISDDWGVANSSSGAMRAAAQLDRVDTLRAAAGLARQFGVTDVREAALTAIADFAPALLNTDDPAPVLYLS